ncbi:serpin B [Novosphingobium kunmingense]|uniref:Serpin B n=1 Tax=Novosphingobium kunmingense TaxID=1211806 RepID=A0A2N0H6V1_9SPHN|nr:serpin family protein [Novosphingobium kunmingense]PKB14673.1 serpin B [Novosphingobium kunmingense]
MIGRLTVLALSASLAACAALPGGEDASFPAAEPDQAALEKSGFRLFELERGKVGPAENTFVSPLSVQQAMGLVHAGTKGTAAREIESALGLAAGSATDAALAAQRKAVTQDTGAAEVRLANALWLSQDLRFRPEYLVATRDSYAAKAARLDFADAPQQSADTINAWASAETKGLIRSIVAPSSFNAATVAVLSNAVFFEGKWVVEFGQAYPQPFLFGDGREAPFPLMSETALYSYAESGGWKAVRLPYKASENGSATPRFVMDVFVPLKRNADAMLGAAAYAGLTAALDNSAPERVTVTLPRFEIGWKETLNDSLIGLGIRAAFQPGVGDFGAMFDPGGKRMVISRVSHASKLQVFEAGTRAAAVTAVEMVTTGARIDVKKPKVFRADQPFHLVIRDTASNTVLFVGRIARPEVYDGN